MPLLVSTGVGRAPNEYFENGRQPTQGNRWKLRAVSLQPGWLAPSTSLDRPAARHPHQDTDIRTDTDTAVLTLASTTHCLESRSHAPVIEIDNRPAPGPDGSHLGDFLPDWAMFAAWRRMAVLCRRRLRA